MKPNNRYVPPLNRKESLLNSSIQLHNGRGIISRVPRPHGKLAALFELLGLLSTVTGLGLIWYSGVI